ncbi:MAG: ATP-binding protein [Balneolaceae bacterium]
MPQPYKLKIKSEFSESERVLDFINEIDDDLHFDEDLKSKIELAVSEAVTNAIVHGNKLDEEKSVTVTGSVQNNRIVFKVTDEGPGFDYSQKPDPTADENLLKLGGRGLFIIDELADDVRFENDGRSVIIIFNF